MAPNERACPKCGEAIRGTPVTCKHCGFNFATGELGPVSSGVSAQKHQFRNGMIVLAVGFGLLLVFAGYGGSNGTSPKAAPESAPSSSPTPQGDAPQSSGAITPWLKAEDIVTFPQGMIACIERDDLAKVTMLGATGHKTQMMAYFDPSSDGGLRCIMLSTRKRYKVIDSEANSPDMPEALIIQVVGEGIQSADKGAYAMVLDRTMASIQR